MYDDDDDDNDDDQHYTRLEISDDVNFNCVALTMTPCTLVDRYQHF